MVRRRHRPSRSAVLARLLLAGAALTAPLAAAPVAPAKTVLVIEGRGFGHGVGLSQYGAYGFARHGRSYRQILAHYYPGTSYGRVSGQTIGVDLADGRASVRFAGAGDVGGRAVDPGRTYHVVVTKKGLLELRDDKGKKLLRGRGALAVTRGGGPVQLLGRSGDGITDGAYRGALVLVPQPGRRIGVVNRLDLEDYLRGVVGSESPSGWPAAALQAQAVAARSYAVATGAGHDLYADTRSQVYHGVAAETGATDAAIAGTRGLVLMSGGRVATTYFFSTSGGRTEAVQYGFPGAAPVPYLVSVSDPYDTTSPKHTWRVRLSMDQANARLGGLVPGRLRRIEVLQHGDSPRIVRARLVGSRGSAVVDGLTLKSRLHLYDTWARFSFVTTAVKTHRTRVVVPATRSAAAAAVPDVLRAFTAPIRPASFTGWASFSDVTAQAPQPTTGGAALAPGGAPASASAVPTPAPAKAAKPRVRVHRVVRLSGRLTGRTRPIRLAVQRAGAAGRWRTVTKLRTSARGFYSYAPSRPGVYRVRTKALIGPPVRVRLPR